MEQKFFRYRYDWHQLNCMVQCNKCGNHIVFQNTEGFPECNECGNVNSLSWENTLKEMDIVGMKKGGSDHKTMMGTINGNVRIKKTDHIHCFSCQHPVSLPEQDEPINVRCTECSTALSFKIFNNNQELVFYKAGKNTNQQKANIQPIAVRCVSCGGPLEVDPTKNNFTCKFCATENILPPSLRYKTVVDDVFVAFRNSKYIKLAAFENNGVIVEQALRENGKASFDDNELNEILIKNKDDINVYKQITDEFKYLPSDKILNELFNTSKEYKIIEAVGLRLQKTNDEILDKIEVVLPGYKKVKKQVVNYQSSNKQPASLSSKSGISKFKSPFFIIIIIVFIITLIMLVSSF